MEQSTGGRTASAVRAELARRNMTRAELADALGWSRTTLWRRLAGTQPFDVDELTAVAAHLDVPLSALLPDHTAA